MNRKLTVSALAIGVLLVSVLANTALAADSLTVTRSNGTIDTFAVIPCPSGCAAGVVKLYHIAIAANGAGQVYSNDLVGTPGTVCNLISGGWITSNTDGQHQELHVRAYDSGGSVVEWIWGASNIHVWSGPYELAQ